MSRNCPAIIEVLPRQNSRATAIRIFPSKAAYIVSTGGEPGPGQAELLNDLAKPLGGSRAGRRSTQAPLRISEMGPSAPLPRSFTVFATNPVPKGSFSQVRDGFGAPGGQERHAAAGLGVLANPGDVCATRRRSSPDPSSEESFGRQTA